MLRYVEHMMAGIEAEPFERRLQRQGPSPAEAGADHFKGHGISPAIAAQNGRLPELARERAAIDANHNR
jgi:hypothetical protein